MNRLIDRLKIKNLTKYLNTALTIVLLIAISVSLYFFIDYFLKINEGKETEIKIQESCCP